MDNDRSYDLPDPQLRSYDHAIGTLSVDGELKGYVACVVGQLHGGDPWPWFVVVWLDGTKELAFEDYGPAWTTVRELDAGYLDHAGPIVVENRRFLGLRYQVMVPGPACVFDFAWLPADDGARMWHELGLRDGDF